LRITEVSFLPDSFLPEKVKIYLKNFFREGFVPVEKKNK